jgi:Fe-S oxidoreductase
VYKLIFDKDLCAKCETIDCLMRCQYMDMDIDAARAEKQKLIDGEDSQVLKECVTCYACEEYCPFNNHPFYLIVERQEEKGIWPVPKPVTNQQHVIMAPKSEITSKKVQAPVINMCAFSMLEGSISGKLFEGVSIISGSDIFCNIMWLHFAKNSTIRERLPKAIDNMWEYYLKDSDVDEVVQFHDECYGAYTHLAPAFGIKVPFKSVHLFEYLIRKLDELKDQIKPINQKVAYQRPCSNRLIPETQRFVDEIFSRIGVERVRRKYDYDNALCCAFAQQAQQRDQRADDTLKRNVDDMIASGAAYCVFNCPACFFAMSEAVANGGLIPILMSDLCKIAIGEL